MNEKEYKEKLKQLEVDFEANKKQLYIDFAQSNKRFEIGDILKEHDKIILVDKITTYIAWGLPEAVYHGYELKKDLSIRKDKSRGSIYGDKVAELIKKTTK